MLHRHIARRTLFFGVIVVGASAPISFSPSSGFEVKTAECQNGTCCPEDKSTCVIGDYQNVGYYQKPSGSCAIQEH